MKKILNAFSVLKKEKNLVIYLIMAIYLVVLYRTAWISDDAAITLRTVLNLINGYGPVFNIDERVQAYTHPLWFIIISIASYFINNVFAATILISIALSFFSVLLVLMVYAKSTDSIIFIGLGLIFSKSFIDYSTSGLENPLSHVLFILAIYFLFHIKVSKVNVKLFFLTCAAIYLNRPDLLLIIFPAAIYVAIICLKFDKESVITVLTSAVPLVAWVVFSFVYYGHPLPNTAYAKLGNGIEFGERAEQGVKYFIDTFQSDPIVLPVIFIAAVVGFFKNIKIKLIVLGILFYLIYIVYIGGDFMSGRFFTVPYMISLILLSMAGKTLLIPLSIFVVVMGAGSLNANIIAGSSYSNRAISSDGIADERGYYFQKTGLIAGGEWLSQPSEWKVGKREVRTTCTLGFQSIRSGPGIHFVDYCALADPLLARLPAKFDENWRVGHYYRQIPTNYIESLESSQNLLLDDDLRKLWDSIIVVTRGEIWSVLRFSEILKLNSSARPSVFERYRFEPILKTDILPVLKYPFSIDLTIKGYEWNKDPNIIFSRGIRIDVSEVEALKKIDVALDGNDVYEVWVRNNENFDTMIGNVGPTRGTGMAIYSIILPEAMINLKEVFFIPSRGDGRYSIGHFFINKK